VLGNFAQQLALLPVQLQAAAIPTAAPGAELLRSRIPLAASGRGAETVIPLRHVANSSLRLNSEGKSQVNSGQYGYTHEKENVPPADLRYEVCMQATVMNRHFLQRCNAG
jgi:hypothetical protein